MSSKLVAGAAILAFIVLWVVNSVIRLPAQYLEAGSVVSAIVFITLPILCIYCVSALEWKPLFAVIGIAIFLGIVALISPISRENVWFGAAVQVARIGWPLCLGIVISGLVKDKNLLLPMAAVLATVDILAVLSPVGTVKHGLQSEAVRPIFDALAYQVPKVGSITPAAQMGPADPLFLGMFFYALHRFHMRTRETLLWIIPALALYLLTVIVFGKATVLGVSLGALPALVPIGLVIVIVNRKEFDMTPSERAMTWGIVACCALLLIALCVVWQPGNPTAASDSLGHFETAALQLFFPST